MLYQKIKIICFSGLSAILLNSIFASASLAYLADIPRNSTYVQNKVQNTLELTRDFFNQLNSQYLDFQEQNKDRLDFLGAKSQSGLHPFTLFYSSKEKTTNLAQISQASKLQLDNLLYSEYLTSMEAKYQDIIQKLDILIASNQNISASLDEINKDSQELQALLDLNTLLQAYAKCLYANKEASLKDIEALVKDFSENDFFRLIYADLLLQNNFPKQSLQIIAELSSKDPRNAKKLYIKALAEMMQAQYALAISDLDDAIRGVPDSPELFLARGVAKQYQQNSKSACADFHEACILGDCSGLGSGLCK